MNFTSISDNEKNQLKNRITSSIFSYIKKHQHIKYGVGIMASILTIISIGFYHHNNNTSSIDSYVKTIENIDGKGLESVKLILSDSQNIDIAEEDSNISYSNSGQQVRIGGLKTINQSKLKNDKVVYNTLMVPYGKRSQIELSDGTKVWLNSGSKLVYPIVFNGDKREVYLEGEGIFEVTHDKSHPFIVKAQDHEIEVLGTVFNVSNYTDENTISTTLKSGSVQIHYKGDSFFKLKDKIKMYPGTMATYYKNKNAIRSKKVNVENYFSWRDGVFIFKNDNLKYIMKRLSIYYNVEITIDDVNLANQTFSGYLDLKDSVDKVIQTIKKTTKFELYIKENNKIIITQIPEKNMK